MKQFSGFPDKMQFTAIPRVFLSSLLPQIDDVAELKTTLYIFHLLCPKRGYPRYTTYSELLGNVGLMNSLRGGEKPPDEVLRKALEMATKRGTVLHLVLDRDGTSEDVYFLNTESDRRAVAKIKNGELVLDDLEVGEKAYRAAETEPLPNIYTVYEENIGILTPMIAEELKEAEKLYPEAWIRDAIKEAALSKKGWRFIASILERWSSEGKSDGTYRRDFKKTDPDKYIKGKYGHMVRR